MISGNKQSSDTGDHVGVSRRAGTHRCSDGQRRAPKAITLFVLILSVIGCGGKRHNQPGAARNKAESISVEVDTLKIGSEKYIADLGSITVPENRSLPASRLITIPFLRIRSHASSPSEPILALAGGPGQSNMSWDKGKASAFLPKRDFVTVGYRGVDGSCALDIPEMREALRKNGNTLSEKSLRAIGRAWTAGAERLKAEGVDLDGYTMLEVIEDNESVRKALGYERIDLLSESYGTRIAYLYGLRHPDRIFRSAMIAVNPPGRFVWDSEMIDLQLRHYSALWASDPGMSSRCPDLYASMRRVLRKMPRSWLVFPIDPGKVRVVTFALLFHRKTAAMAFDAYVAADRGDPSGLALMSIAYHYVIPSIMIWGDAACKAYSADFDSTRDYPNVDDAAATPLGSPMTEMVWGPLHYGRWPMKMLPEEFRKLRSSDIETLLLSGSADFSTPAEFASRDLLPHLKNGKQVLISEAGHVGDLWYLNMENTKLILSSFYDTGVPDTSKNSYVRMSFSAAYGFPFIAKAAVAAILLTAAGLITLSIFILKKIRRRREPMKVA